MTRAKYTMFTCEPMSGKEAFEAHWASESVPEERLEERTEELAREIALTPTDLLMLTKRSINRQFEVMGFRTGIASSVDLLALSGFREQGLYGRGGRDVRDGGDEFLSRAHRDGLKEALAWREEAFGNRYRGNDDDSD